MENKKRIFIGVKISRSLAGEISVWQKSLEQELPVHWIGGNDLHITLLPPWHEEDKNIAKVKKRFQSFAGKFKPFIIQFHTVCYGPNPETPRLIWADGETSLEMIELKKKMEKVFHKEPEKRDFKLHLTLARFREEKFESFPVQKLCEQVSWKDRVESVTLFESPYPLGSGCVVLDEVKF